MSFGLTIFVLTTLLLLQLIPYNCQSRSSHLGQFVTIDVSGGSESGLFLSPAAPSSASDDDLFFTKFDPSNDSTSATSSSVSSSATTASTASITYFSPLSPSQPIHVKASFGSISASETIFPNHRPHFDSYLYPRNQLKTNGSVSKQSTSINNPSLPVQPVKGANFRDKINKESTLVETEQQAYGRDSTAYLITPSMSRNSPVLRVLFYSTHSVNRAVASTISSTGDHQTRTSSNTNINNNSPNLSHDASPCIFVSVSKDGENLIGSCTPSNDREGACLVEITLPAYWWPSVELDTALPKSQKPALASVDYKIYNTNQCAENGSLLMDHIKKLKTFTNAFTHLGIVTLSPFTGGYEEVTNDDIVRILIPQQPTFPNNKIYIPVCFRYNPNYPMASFRLRARVKSGLRILGVQSSPSSSWKISIEINSKQTLATVTAKLKDDSMIPDDLQSDDAGVHILLSQEIFSWLIQVNENVDFSDNGRIVWQLEYVTEIDFDSENLDSSSSASSSSVTTATAKDFDRDTSKLSSILDIQKDDIQAVIGITKSLSMINVAVLTGRQVAQPLRVFAVSQAGRVGDVTLQASCSSTDESVLKVSPSCTSIYLDGSEIRGSSNATILIKYGTYTGQANFLVWMPKLPLEIRLSDSKLSQIKGWKIPHLKRDTRQSYHHSSRENSIFGQHHKSRRSSSPTTASGKRFNYQKDEVDMGVTDNDIGCRLRHQQAYLQVYGRFFSVDHNSGRESYLLNRKIYVQLTGLVTPFLRLSDNRIAMVRNNIIEGLSPGRAEIQIVSPITNRLLGSKEIRVGNDKETITQLEVNLVAGLSLLVKPEGTLPNVWKISTAINSKLITQYQEGLLDIKAHFSDGSVVSLSDISDSDYQLSVNTFDNGIIAYAPLPGQPYPRVIAIGQGKSQLHVSLEVSDQCQRKRTQPLAMTYVNAEVDLNLPSVNLQNDADFRKYNGIMVHRNQSQPSLHQHHLNRFDEDSLINSASRLNVMESQSNIPSIEARSNRALGSSDLTPLEVGMYSMLGVFSLAVTLFIASCLLFRFKGKQSSDLIVTTLPVPGHCSSSNQKVVANANDWIWLSKATLQRSSPIINNGETSQRVISLNDFDSNPCNLEVSKENGSNRMSTISYPGSEISIRITTNPVEEICPDQEATPKPSTPFGLNREIEKFSRSFSPVSLSSIPPPVPARRTKGSSTNYHHIQPVSTGREPIVNLTSEPIIIPNHKPPHIPPRLTRHIRSDQMPDSSYSSRPPPVPPHSSSSQATKKPPLPPHRTALQKPKRPVTSKKQPIMTTVAANFKNTKESKNTEDVCSALEDMTQEKWNKVTKDMNYKQLMEYFQNLKESSA